MVARVAVNPDKTEASDTASEVVAESTFDEKRKRSSIGGSLTEKALELAFHHIVQDRIFETPWGVDPSGRILLAGHSAAMAQAPRRPL